MKKTLFGTALADILSSHGIQKTDFAAASTIDRNHVNKIISGQTRSPAKIAEIFIGLSALGVPRPDLIRLAVLYLEDRRTDAGFSSTEITIQQTFGSGVSPLPRRDRLIALYDANPDIRAALDIIVDAILYPDTVSESPADLPAVAALAAAETPETYA